MALLFAGQTGDVRGGSLTVMFPVSVAVSLLGRRLHETSGDIPGIYSHTTIRLYPDRNPGGLVEGVEGETEESDMHGGG